ncbi:MAG TPA: aldehyde dehydrogenase family protein [Vicinamibacterales bacterium]|nr:aldehyde dehydrogenase family protein [Vicinamibacterales bacterium]
MAMRPQQFDDSSPIDTRILLGRFQQGDREHTQQGDRGRARARAGLGGDAQGQKCSACSRVYVSQEVRATFVALLVEKTKKINVGNPLEKDVWMGPVVNEEQFMREQSRVRIK